MRYFLILSAVAFTFAAECWIEKAFSYQMVEPGDTVRMQIRVDLGSENVSGLDFYFSYDDEKIEILQNGDNSFPFYNTYFIMTAPYINELEDENSELWGGQMHLVLLTPVGNPRPTVSGEGVVATFLIRVSDDSIFGDNYEARLQFDHMLTPSRQTSYFNESMPSMELEFELAHDLDLPVGTLSNEPQHAAQFSLLQNYPNPFNASTEIRFELHQAGNVHLELYDFRGRSVKTLIQGFLPAGEQTLQWYAGSLASGLYFVQLRSPNAVARHKILYLK